jgi:hypothetical protein
VGWKVKGISALMDLNYNCSLFFTQVSHPNSQENEGQKRMKLERYSKIPLHPPLEKGDFLK